MGVRLRHYNNPDDYQRVDHFLIEHYQPGNEDGNWIEPAWEYMHSHPFLDKASLVKIGIWEDDEKIVALAHYESRLGEAFFQFHPAYKYLKEQMLDYAEDNLYGRSKDGRKCLQAYVNDNDEEFLSLVRGRGYEKDDDGARSMSAFPIPDPFPSINLPAGYRLKSLAEDCDWVKIHRVLWRGFNHPGEPPEEDLEERKKMQDTPNFKLDLKIVVETPNGDFASFCGMWYEPTHRYAYVEPVATDPDYRRMGLGRAAVMEGIRRCGVLGTTVAYVGSDQEFYKSMGFRVIHIQECWVKHLNEEKIRICTLVGQ
jgi:ribosomal protein S18 acetylase RimI-like enzyme